MCRLRLRTAPSSKTGAPGGPLARWGKDEQGSGRSFRHPWRKRSPAYFVRTHSPRMPPSALRGGSVLQLCGVYSKYAERSGADALKFRSPGVTSNKGARRPPCAWSFQGGVSKEGGNRNPPSLACLWFLSARAERNPPEGIPLPATRRNKNRTNTSPTISPGALTPPASAPAGAP